MANRKHSFRTALLVLVLGSLSLTVGIIGAVAFFTSNRAVDDLRERQYDLTSRLMAREVTRLLTIAPKLLQSQVALTQREVLDPEDLNALGLHFAETLRYEPDLSWLSYGSAITGGFVGAWRNLDGEIVVNRSEPGINDGRPTEFILRADGNQQPIDNKLPPGYDPRDKAWFKSASDSVHPVWSEIYSFNEGVPGLTLSLANRSLTTGDLRGVFTADYTLKAVGNFLNTLAVGSERVLMLMTPDGQIMGSASSLSGDEIFNATLAALPVSHSEIQLDSPIGFAFDYEDHNMIGVVRRLEPLPGFFCVAVFAADEREFFGAARTNAKTTLVLGLCALLGSAGISFLLAGRLARPLAQISEDLQKIARFDLQKVVQSPSLVHEIAIVGESVERMKAGLRSFGRYVPTTLVRSLLSQGLEAELGAVDRRLTIVFADLAGFTALSESLTPTQTVEEMSEFFQLATEAVETHSGTLDKFLGDGLLAFFNAPLDVPDHAEKACISALEIRDRLAATRPQRIAQGRPLLKARFGINTGEVLVGNIGTKERFAYTVIGDHANLASRLEGLNKQYGTEILAAESVRQSAGDTFAWRKVDRVAVVGRNEATTVYELLGRSDTIAPRIIALRDTYEAAMEAYYSGNFVDALAQFEVIAATYPEDLATTTLAARCSDLLQDPPDCWSGIFFTATK